MPATKNQDIRLEILDELLSLRKWSIEEFLGRVNQKIGDSFAPITSRTLFRDINYLIEKKNAPIPNLDKIGQLIIYLVDKIDERYRQKVYLTKLLKLLYIIDETAIKETGAPVTGLDYRIWKMGPVAFEVYKDLKYDNSEKLSFFVEAKKDDHDESALIQSINQFDDSVSVNSSSKEAAPFSRYFLWRSDTLRFIRLPCIWTYVSFRKEKPFLPIGSSFGMQ